MQKYSKSNKHYVRLGKLANSFEEAHFVVCVQGHLVAGLF